jgi:hypothetical protein
MAHAAAGSTAYQGPSTVHLALVTTTPSKTVAGTEVTAGNYARKSYAQSNWTVEDAGALVNPADISWTAASEDFEAPVVAVEGYDAATDGNRLWYIILENSRAIIAGQPPTFYAGDLELDFV